MDSQSDFQILQSITIPMIYRLFVFIFRYSILILTLLESYSFFLNGQLYHKLDIVLICLNKS